MKRIPLTQGQYAIVDDLDYSPLMAFKWHARAIRRKRDKFEAVRNRRAGEDYPSAIVKMHRQITNAPVGMDVDHQNGDPLDNRRENLRVCTRSQNTMNTPKRYGRSRFKGVSWQKQQKQWHCRIWHGGKALHLGFFDDQEEAAVVYDVAAQIFHGEFARLNFPIRSL